MSPDPHVGSAEPTNPFDPEALRADPTESDVPTRRVLHRVAVRKPGRTEFFRVHPDAAYTTDIYLIETGEGIETEKYVVVPALAHEIVTETSVRRLFTCVNRLEKPFLWPAKLPQGDSPNSWTSTALEVSESAKRYWVRLIPDVAARQYEESRAEGLLEEPKWPELTFGELIELGFKNKLISDYDHEVLRRLRGEL